MVTEPIYAVIGSGKQGTAEGYDLACFGGAARVIMADRSLPPAQMAADRINTLTGKKIAVPVAVDAADEAAVTRMLREYGVTTCCGAAHYALNLPLTHASIAAGAHFCDMGGNTDVVHHQHKLHDDAVRSGVTVIPDCGIAPGTANVLAARAIRSILCDAVTIYCGGLPQNRHLPLGYRIVFSVKGLTNEYTGNCVEIRDGRIVELPAFTEREIVDLPEPVGRCEAFLTSGGTSTGPWSFLGKIRRYGYKTVRYLGHYDAIRAMIDMGMLSLEPLEVEGSYLVPRDLFHVLAEKFWDYPLEPDLLIMRVVARGRAGDGAAVEMIQDLLDFQDDVTGMTAMERTTAYSASIVAQMMTRRELTPGVLPLELAVNPDGMVEELQRRGIRIETAIRTLPQGE